MEIKSSVGLAVGPANATHWGQVLVMPTAYGIIEIEDTSGHAQQLGVAALSFISESLNKGITSLLALEELADRVADVGLQTLILLIPVGKVVYVVLRGKGAVYIKRGGELAKLMHENGGISGEVHVGDVVLLASAGFARILSHDELSGLFDHLTPMDIAEKLTIILHEKSDGEGSVALVFGVTELTEASYVMPSVPQKDLSKEESISFRSTIVNKIATLTRYPLFVRVKEYVVSLRHRPRERTRAFAILAGIVFAISVILGIWKQSTVKKNAQLIAAISDAQHSLDEGIALAELNPLKSRERLVKAKEIILPYSKTASPRTREGRQITLLSQAISDNLTQVLQVVHVPLTLFYDVSLLKKNAVVSDIALEDDTLVIADKATQTIYTLSVSSKNAEIVGGGAALKSVISVGLHGTKMYALTPEGVMAFDTSTDKSSVVIKKDDSWGFITSLVSFGGNIYLLDTEKSRIWKYVATETGLPAQAGFSDIREYLNPDTLPDLSLTTSMTIDGSIWLGTTNGKVFRFTQGKDNSIVPQGVDPTLGANLVVYTSDETKNVYVLDSDNHRVVVLDKTGMYLSQYQFDGNVTPTKLTVSESAKKILLLAGGKIYALDLK